MSQDNAFYVTRHIQNFVHTCWHMTPKGVCVRLSVCYLLAQGHAAAQSAGEADDFGHKRFESEVFLEHDSSQDGLHLWNT